MVRFFRIVSRACLVLLVVAAACPVVRAAEAEWRFVALSDPHIAHSRELARFRQFLHTVAAQNPDFVLITGDICGHAPEFLPQVQEVIAASGLTVHLLPGNHDDNYGRNPQWWTDADPRGRYNFDHKGVRFILNWSQRQDLEWVGRQLAEAKDRPIVFCQHYPPADKDDQGASVSELLAGRANIKLLLCGHTHGFADQLLGSTRAVTMRNCNFAPGLANPGDYYLVEALPGGQFRLTAQPLTKLELLSPPDELPTVAVEPLAEVLSGAVVLRGTARDDRGLAKVQVSVDHGPWAAAEGLDRWSFRCDTAALADGHHVFRLRAIDSAKQATVEMPLLLHLVQNAPPPRPNVLAFQQGLDGYDGCTDASVRKHAETKGTLGADGEMIDLENWIGSAGQTEYSEFYIRFDLSKAKLPAGTAIRRATLTLLGSRQNGVKETDTDKGRYTVDVLKAPWTEKMTFGTRPGAPGRSGQKEPDPKPDLTGTWPYLGGRQIVWPPRPVKIDLTPLKDTVSGWLKDTGTNHGLAFAPYGANYNFSAQSSKSPLRTLRPCLEIEIERR